MPESTATRVLRQPAMAGAARAVAPVGVSDDPVVRALVEREVAAAYERGLEDGRRQGVTAVQDERATVAQALSEAGRAAQEAVTRMGAELADRTGDLALEIVEAVLPGLPDEHATGLVSRLRRALDRIDDTHLRVRVHPAQCDDVAAAVAGQAGPETTVEVVADATLSLGEARIDGVWSDADLTWDAVLDAVRREVQR